MLVCLAEPREDPEGAPIHSPGPHFCKERSRLQAEILDAIRQVSALLTQQTRALIDDDPDFARFDILLQMAQQRKEAAKYAWIAHVEFHGCE